MRTKEMACTFSPSLLLLQYCKVVTSFILLFICRLRHSPSYQFSGSQTTIFSNRNSELLNYYLFDHSSSS